MSKPRNNLIGHTIFLTSEKYRMLPVIGHTMFFTSEKSDMTLFESNNLSKTQQNVALLKDFLTLKNESRLMHTSANLSLWYERKTTTKTTNPAHYVL